MSENYDKILRVRPEGLNSAKTEHNFCFKSVLWDFWRTIVRSQKGNKEDKHMAMYDWNGNGKKDSMDNFIAFPPLGILVLLYVLFSS